MRSVYFLTSVALSLGLVACSKPKSVECAHLTRERASEMAGDALRSSLESEPVERRTDFADSYPVDVELRTGGFAAKASFRGRHNQTMTALIYDDCYVGWTSSTSYLGDDE